MIDTPLLSVIVPVYNTSATLKRCFDSICKQTYTNLEIIVVDDGSTDGASDIADEYAKKDSRIKVFHQENAGESVARNVGLRQVTGDYFTFVDCDDWLELDMYENMMQTIQAHNVDIAACSWFKDFDNKSEAVQNEGYVQKGSFDREQLLTYIYQRDLYRGFTYIWDKIYRRNLMYNEAGRIIEFPVDLKIGGDIVFLARMVFNAKTATYLDRPFYHYYQRMDSGSHSKNLKKRMDWIQAYVIILEYIESKGIETKSRPWIERFLAYHSSNVAELAYEQKDFTAFNKCKNFMKRYQTVYERTNSEHLERIERYRRIMNIYLD